MQVGNHTNSAKGQLAQNRTDCSPPSQRLSARRNARSAYNKLLGKLFRIYLQSFQNALANFTKKGFGERL